MQKKRKDNQFIKQAFYEGGNKAFREFIYSNLKYPKEAVEEKIEGIVHLRIDIDHKGKVTDAKVSKGIGYGCDEEAIRIMKLAEYSVSKGLRKVRVAFQKDVRIEFRLSMIKKKVPKKEPIIKEVKEEHGTPNGEIQYHLRSSKPNKVNKDKKGGSINYTIEF